MTETTTPPSAADEARGLTYRIDNQQLAQILQHARYQVLYGRPIQTSAVNIAEVCEDLQDARTRLAAAERELRELLDFMANHPQDRAPIVPLRWYIGVRDRFKAMDAASQPRGEGGRVMRGDILNRIPGVDVSGGLGGVWRYSFRVGRVEVSYTTGIRWTTGGKWFRSQWGRSFRLRGFHLIVWNRGMRDQP